VFVPFGLPGYRSQAVAMPVMKAKHPALRSAIPSAIYWKTLSPIHWGRMVAERLNRGEGWLESLDPKGNFGRSLPVPR